MFTTLGLDYNNNVVSGNQPPQNLYMGLITEDLNTYSTDPQVLAALTSADIGIAFTEQVNYDQVTRVPFLFNAASANGIITNSDLKCTFTFNADNQNFQGVFLTTESTKSANSGTLIAIFRLGSAITRNTGDSENIEGQWIA